MANSAAARADLLHVIHNLRNAGASVIVKGEPELAELLLPSDVRESCILPEIHLEAAVDWMLARSPEALP